MKRTSEWTPRIYWVPVLQWSCFSLSNTPYMVVISYYSVPFGGLVLSSLWLRFSANPSNISHKKLHQLMETGNFRLDFVLCVCVCISWITIHQSQTQKPWAITKDIGRRTVESWWYHKSLQSMMISLITYLSKRHG